MVEHLGRTALRMKGAAALLPELEIRNGVVEFDIAVSGERGFAGALFRYLGAGNSEHFYIRPHQSAIRTRTSTSRCSTAAMPGSCTTATAMVHRSSTG